MSNPVNSDVTMSAAEEFLTPRKKAKGTPYIPSYMDMTNGPEPCVVCGDAATGYHYRCMTCEGCKGFFRRTIQKNLQYHCKWTGNCIIDKNSRNQCQQCRFIKCLRVGMATDLVLNEKQRVAKRKLIEDNRERRRTETTTKHDDGSCNHDCLSANDHQIIQETVNAYTITSNIDDSNVPFSLGIRSPQIVTNERTFVTICGDRMPCQERMTMPQKTVPKPYNIPVESDSSEDNEAWVQLAKIMTPSICKVVEFAKRVPGFASLAVEDQINLLKACCMEIMCLRVACRYSPDHEALIMHNGMMISRNQVSFGSLAYLVEPIFDFAVGLSKLKLDREEVALLAAVLLVQSDRSGLRDSESVEKVQDAILGAFKRYVAKNRPEQPVHWAKILMKVTDLRTISTRHADRLLCTKLDSPVKIPPMFLEMFVDDDSFRRRSDSLASYSGSTGSTDGSPSVKSEVTNVDDEQSNCSSCSSPDGYFQPVS